MKENEKRLAMEKFKSCISYIIGGLMGLITMLGMFISTKGYYTNEAINFDPSISKNEARKIFHGIGNGFTGITFTQGGGMIIQSIFQILLIIGSLLLIALAVFQTLKTFHVIKNEDLLFDQRKARKVLDILSLLVLLFSLIVFIEYIACAKSLHYSIGLGSVFNFVAILLILFGRKILESKLNITSLMYLQKKH